MATRSLTRAQCEAEICSHNYYNQLTSLLKLVVLTVFLNQFFMFIKDKSSI
jgi:hypothetical protein